LLLVLTPVGTVSLLLWAWAMPHRSRWILLSAVAGFIAAQCVSAQLWQRYTEPFVLMLVALMAAEVWPTTDRSRRRLGIVGPVVLAVALAGVTTFKISTGPTPVDLGRKTLTEETKMPRERVEPGPDHSPPEEVRPPDPMQNESGSPSEPDEESPD
jgi:hypothetical protein